MRKQGDRFPLGPSSVNLEVLLKELLPLKALPRSSSLSLRSLVSSFRALCFFQLLLLSPE